MAQLPNSAEEWETQAQVFGIQNLSIHDGDSRLSGSKMNVQQFLLLRVFWPDPVRPSFLYQRHVHRWVEPSYLNRSQSFLASLPIKSAWSAYLRSIGKTPKLLCDEGFVGLQTFTLVRYHQIQSLDPEFEADTELAKVDVTPIARRTRAQVARAERPSTPTPSTNNAPVIDLLAKMGIGESPNTPVIDSSPDWQTPIEAFSPFTEYVTDQFKAIQDEQIVNTALILYLNALTIHFPDLQADWTLHRRAFVSLNKAMEKTYEARVDGFLKRRRDKEPLIILEVKPFQRYKKPSGIRMQESAQMAAWISQHPPRDLQDMRSNSKKGHRLLISQDRHEIYLTFGQFDAAYLDYIRHRAPGSSFLVMNEYGPFDIGQEKHMEYLGEIVLGFALQACDSM
ncbi:hypothetical protein F5Y10DRAFT_235195 [Nemania abortiva]|nr:hypothetical protein F5Y10DRAFT_235195 [Nemania abortiva]